MAISLLNLDRINPNQIVFTPRDILPHTAMFLLNRVLINPNLIVFTKSIGKC